MRCILIFQNLYLVLALREKSKWPVNRNGGNVSTRIWENPIGRKLIAEETWVLWGGDSITSCAFIATRLNRANYQFRRSGGISFARACNPWNSRFEARIHGAIRATELPRLEYHERDTRDVDNLMRSREQNHISLQKIVSYFANLRSNAYGILLSPLWTFCRDYACFFVLFFFFLFAYFSIRCTLLFDNDFCTILIDFSVSSILIPIVSFRELRLLEKIEVCYSSSSWWSHLIDFSTIYIFLLVVIFRKLELR